MNNNLRVTGAELEKISAETKSLLVVFQQVSDEFNQTLVELGNHWQGEDYNAMKNAVETKIKPIITVDESVTESIPNLMKSISNELDQKVQDYRNIQSANVSYWG